MKKKSAKNDFEYYKENKKSSGKPPMKKMPAKKMMKSKKGC